MALVRPRLNDYHGLPFTQEAVDFAIPFLDDDIPLYVDPFLLWKSPSQQDRALHTQIVAALNGIGQMALAGRKADAKALLIAMSECQEAGLGHARNKKGRRISKEQAEQTLEVFEAIPDVRKEGLQHIETVQLCVDGIAKDRISDFTCSLLKSFLIDFTIDQCARHAIPCEEVVIGDIYDPEARKLSTESVRVPVTPGTRQPLLLIPKRWLRFSQWINYEDYYKNAFVRLPPGVAPDTRERVAVLNFNRSNYGVVRAYVETRERTAADCTTDPLFQQIPIHSAKRTWAAIKKLPTGKTHNADKKYEELIEQLLASLFYPQLDFAEGQSRTDSGALIRDLVFYNSQSLPFLEEIRRTYDSRQIVFELKNVAAIEREHVNQLNRYLAEHFGRFGALVTRNGVSRAIERNIVDLWSGQRKCIVVLTDEDIALMVQVFESKQRAPIEVLQRAYVEFTRRCPS